MNVYKRIKYNDKLKAEGHALIDEIEAMGTHRSVCYAYMAQKLSLPEGEVHFTHKNDEDLLARMVSVLQQYRDKIVERRKRRPWRGGKPLPTKPPPLVKYIRPKQQMPAVPKEKSKFKVEVLPRDQYVRAMDELRASRATPQRSNWFTKLIRVLL